MPNDKYGMSLSGPDGGPYQVRSFNVSFYRQLGNDGRPSSMVTGGTINFSALVTKESSLLAQMINSSNKPIKSGKLEITTAQQEGVFRTVAFTDAFVSSYTESFSEGGSEYPVDFVLTCQTITIGDAKLDNKWPVTS